MSSSEDRRSTGLRFANIFKWWESIFRRRKIPIATYPASSSSGGIAMPVAEIAQQKGSSASEVKGVKNDPEVPASLPSTSNAPTPAEVGIATQTAVDVVEIREDHLSRAVKEIDPAKPTGPNEPIEANEIAEDRVSSDTVNTLDRYRKAIERMEKALQLRRKSWETFELSAFNSLPLGEQDSARLESYIDKFLDSRLRASKNRSKWGECKHIIQQCFKALAPFTKTVLSIGMHSAQVPSPMGTLD
jgi:hypothetical protein